MKTVRAVAIGVVAGCAIGIAAVWAWLVFGYGEGPEFPY